MAFVHKISLFLIFIVLSTSVGWSPSFAQSDPKDAATYHKDGLKFWKANNFDAATESFRKAIDVDPTFVPAYFHWGNMLFQLDRFDEAIAKYREATELEPKLLAAYFNWGNALAGQGKMNEAIEKFQRLSKSILP
jgi:tetratricopeptide (TPR) repeat protein